MLIRELQELHASLDEANQVKFLWQWSTSKQMDLSKWKPYLDAHCKEVARLSDWS